MGGGSAAWRACVVIGWGGERLPAHGATAAGRKTAGRQVTTGSAGFSAACEALPPADHVSRMPDPGSAAEQQATDFLAQQLVDRGDFIHEARKLLEAARAGQAALQRAIHALDQAGGAGAWTPAADDGEADGGEADSEKRKPGGAEEEASEPQGSEDPKERAQRKTRRQQLETSMAERAEAMSRVEMAIALARAARSTVE